MCKSLVSVSIYSLFINILGLSGSFYMLQVYDRVIPSRSVPTLVALSILILLLYAFYGFLDIMRTRVLARSGQIFEESTSTRIFSVIAGTPLKTSVQGDILKPSRELDQIKSFISGPGLAMLFDLPWIPVYLGICFFVNLLIGILGLVAIIVLAGLNLIAGMRSRWFEREYSQAVGKRNRIAEAASLNAELVAAMGMEQHAASKWDAASIEISDTSRKMSDVTSFYSGLSKIVRNSVQSAALGIGGYLVINGDLSGGAIIACSIIIARALAPVELMIAHSRGLMQAQQAWTQLKSVFKEFPEEIARTSLPAPVRYLSVEDLYVAVLGQRVPMVSGVNFKVDAGTVVGIIGPSASGKSTLARGLTGVWPILRGRVALDGAGIEQWSPGERGRHIGYMPQQSDFFPGTIAQNIARLDEAADHETIVAAAQAAGAHDMIVGLADGYDTKIGENGAGLSVGQRQRLSLARALYGNPFLVILDEPNSNLDAQGEIALANALSGIRERGGIALVIAHRNAVLSVVDLLLVIEGGRAKAFGPRDAILKGVKQQNQRKTVSGQAGPALAVIENEESPS